MESQNAMVGPTQPQVFLSHVEADKPWSKALHLLLQDGMGFDNQDEVFDFDMPGSDVKVADEIIGTIRSNLAAAPLTIFLVSPRFLGSPFCLAELGGSWVLGRRRACVVVPPCSIGALPVLVQQCALVQLGAAMAPETAKEELHKLSCAVEEATGRKRLAGRWPAALTTFLNDMSRCQGAARLRSRHSLDELKAYMENSQPYRLIEKLLAEGASTDAMGEIGQSRLVSVVNAAGFDDWRDLDLWLARALPAVERICSWRDQCHGRHLAGDSIEIVCYLKALQDGGEPGLADLLESTEPPERQDHSKSASYAAKFHAQANAARAVRDYANDEAVYGG